MNCDNFNVFSLSLSLSTQIFHQQSFSLLDILGNTFFFIFFQLHTNLSNFMLNHPIISENNKKIMQAYIFMIHFQNFSILLSYTTISLKTKRHSSLFSINFATFISNKNRERIKIKVVLFVAKYNLLFYHIVLVLFPIFSYVKIYRI